MTPDEASSGAAGVVHAARRKMKHELGLCIPQFQPATRFYYFAQYNNLYCEHELDYVLFCTSDDTPQPNRDEIDDYVYLSKAELLQRVAPEDCGTQGRRVDLCTQPRV